MFEFKHLPSPGGLYDQNPEFLRRFMYMKTEINKAEKRKEAEKNRRKGGPGSTVRNPGPPP